MTPSVSPPHGELLEKSRILHILKIGALFFFFPQISFKYFNIIYSKLRDGNVVFLVGTDSMFLESHKSLLL